MFATMKPYAPTPPPGVRPPPLWGREDHVRGLLGEWVSDLVTERRTLTVDLFGTGEAFRDFFKANYGPTITAYRSIAAEPDRVAGLDSAMAELGQRFLAGSSAMEWEYRPTPWSTRSRNGGSEPCNWTISTPTWSLHAMRGRGWLASPHPTWPQGPACPS